MMLNTMDSYRDAGLLIIRLGVGASMLMFHGYGKITGGPEAWEKLGGAMNSLGITFQPVFWGFMAAFSESVCSALIMLGILFRPAAFLLTSTMAVAVLRHLALPPGAAGAGWSGASHALELLTVYAGLFLIGPGRYGITIKK